MKSKFDVALRAAKETVRQLEADRIDDLQEQIVELKKTGWTLLEKNSFYYGSHQEYGEGDEQLRYLFAPGVDPGRWQEVDFTHGHFGKNEGRDAFETWLETLSPEKVINLED